MDVESDLIPCLARPPTLFQLQRIYVLTPPSASACSLATRPTIRLEPQQEARRQVLLPGDTVGNLLGAYPREVGGLHEAHADPEPQSGSRSGPSTSAGSAVPGSTVHHGSNLDLDPDLDLDRHRLFVGDLPSLEFFPEAELRLPPDSLCVVTLPLVLGVPAAWLGLPLPTAAPPAGKLAGGAPAAAEGGGAPQRPGQPGRGCAACPGGGACDEVLVLPLVPRTPGSPFSAHLVAGTALYPLS